MDVWPNAASPVAAQKFGARFGRDGVKAYDLHAEEELFSITVSGQDCHGGIDGAISAFGLAKSSARRCMVAYELKRSDTQCPADSEQFADPLQVCCLLTNVSLLLYMDQSCNSMQTALWTHLVLFSIAVVVQICLYCCCGVWQFCLLATSLQSVHPCF